MVLTKKYKTEKKLNKTKQKNAQEESWLIHFAAWVQGVVGTKQAQAAQYIQDHLKNLDIWDIKCKGPGQPGTSWSWPRQNLSHYTIISACIHFWKSEIPPPVWIHQYPCWSCKDSSQNFLHRFFFSSIMNKYEGTSENKCKWPNAHI